VYVDFLLFVVSSVETTRNSLFVPVPQRNSMSASPITVTTKQPPPVVEIQPMSRVTNENVRKVTPESPHRKSQAPLPPPAVTIEAKDEVDAVKARLDSQVFPI
jgi:hypothetical protein